MWKENIKFVYEWFKSWEDIYQPYYNLLGDGVAPLGEWVYTKIKEIVHLEDWLYEVIEDLVYFGKVEFTLDNGEPYVAHNLEELIYALEH